MLAERNRYPLGHLGFQGNNLIRKAGSPWSYTAWELEEISRCALDPIYFVENYVKVKHVDFERKVPMKLRDYQRRMIVSMHENRYTVSRWPRQAGKSSVVCAYVLFLIIFNSNFGALTTAHQANKARDLVACVKDMFEELPPWLQHGVTEWNKGSIRLENGSRVRASATSSSAGRGDTWNAVLMDEIAFVPSHIADDFLKSVMPTISSGKNTKVFMTSTPKGLNTFYKIWRGAVEGKNGYVPIAVEWDDVPGRDEKFRQETIAQFGQQYWDQEFACAFLGSSLTLISGSKLMTIATDTPIEQTDTVNLHERPIRGDSYAMTVDVAEGLGGDSSAVVVINISRVPYRIACVYRSNLVDEVSFAGVVHDLARAYNEALVLVETNIGETVGRILWEDLEYGNIIRTVTKNTQQKMGTNARSRNGVKMNVQTKRIGCNNLKTLVEQDQLVINDDDIYQELCRFVVKGKSYAAESGHDDLAMCLVLFGWMQDQGYVKDLTDVSARLSVARQNQESIERETKPFGFTVVNATEEIAPDRPDPMRMAEGQGRPAWTEDELLARLQDEVMRSQAAGHWSEYPRDRGDPAPAPELEHLTEPGTEWTWKGWKRR